MPPRYLLSMPDEGNSPARWFFGAVLAVGAIAAAASPSLRKRATDSLSKASELAGDSLSASLRTLQQGATRFGHVVLLPADRTLELARDRVLSGVPEAADTKWRTAGIVLRATVVESIGAPATAGAVLEVAGRTYAEASSPGAGWDAVTVREAVRRLTRSLDMEGSERRLNGDVESRTTRCPLLDATEASEQAQLCEAVCGEQHSLMHGLAASASWQLETPERMGTGAEECIRVFRPAQAAGPAADAVGLEPAGDRA
jgi:hypothetical protein